MLLFGNFISKSLRTEKGIFSSTNNAFCLRNSRCTWRVNQNSVHPRCIVNSRLRLMRVTH